TFTRRVTEWNPQTGPEVYLLGHEELHNAACHYLGATRLAGYRDRLHAWADTYRAPGDGSQRWPATTPQYLLRGYPRMLRTGTAKRVRWTGSPGRGPRPAMRTGPRRSPAPSPARTSRRMRGPESPGRGPPPAMRAGLGSWPARLRRSPAPSPTRTSGRGCWSG